MIIDDRKFKGRLYDPIRAYDNIPNLTLIIDPRMVEEMNCKLGGSVTVFQAVGEAIHIFLTDTQRNTPFDETAILIEEYMKIQPSDFKDEEKWPVLVRGVLEDKIGSGSLELFPDWSELNDQEQGEYNLRLVFH